MNKQDAVGEVPDKGKGNVRKVSSAGKTWVDFARPYLQRKKAGGMKQASIDYKKTKAKRDKVKAKKPKKSKITKEKAIKVKKEKVVKNGKLQAKRIKTKKTKMPPKQETGGY